MNMDDNNWKNVPNISDFRRSILERMPKNISNMGQIEGTIFTQSLTREDYIRSMNEIPARLQQQQQQQSQLLHNPNYMQQQPPQQHQQQPQQSMNKQTIILKQAQQPVMPGHQMQQTINVAPGGPKQVRLVQSVRPSQQQSQQFQQQFVPQSQYQIINPNQQRAQLAPTSQITSSSTPPPNSMPQAMQQAPNNNPNQVPSNMPQQQNISNEDDMRYNAKINELSAYIPILENILANQASNTTLQPGQAQHDAKRLRSLIEVLQRKRKVPMDVLLKCEQLIKNQMAAKQITQVQQPPQQQYMPQQVVTPSVAQNNIQSQKVQPQQPQQQNIIASNHFPTQQQPPLQRMPTQQQNTMVPTTRQVAHAVQPSSVPPQPLIQQQIPTPPQPRVPQSIGGTLTQIIENISQSNPVQKSNIRHLLDDIQSSINGIQMKKFKIDSSFEKSKKINALTKKSHIQLDDESQKIPKILLNELASLPKAKYKINLKTKTQTLNIPKIQHNEDENMIPSDDDTSSNSISNDYIILNCFIDESVKLPLVPPIKIFVPFKYPESNPFVEMEQNDNNDDILPEYNSRAILRKVNKIFQENYQNLGNVHSVTQLLDSWFSSIECL